MDNGNYEQNDKKMESVYSTRIRAGKRRTYFFDVRATRANDYFLTITESRKRFDNNGYDRHKIFLYKEDFNKFLKAITEAVDYVKTELMPDFDFDAFNHDADSEFEGEGNYNAPRVAENTIDTAPVAQAPHAAPAAAPIAEPEHDIDPSTITEKKPLEARDTHASQGDNLSNEEVDKW
jgi:hypothetical protein